MMMCGERSCESNGRGSVEPGFWFILYDPSTPFCGAKNSEGAEEALRFAGHSAPAVPRTDDLF